MKSTLYRMEQVKVTGDTAYGSEKKERQYSFHIVMEDKHREFIDEMEKIKATSSYSLRTQYYLVCGLEDGDIPLLRAACERAERY